jgi:hypothetical protein
MTGQPDRELQAWMDDWQGPPSSSSSPAERIQRHVRRRSRLIAAWVAMDIAVGVGFFAFLLHRTITHPDPLEKAAMGLLALVTVGATAFGWWNWRGALRASGASVATYVALATERSRRFQRSVRAGWVILLMQMVVFTPWVAYRLYDGDARPDRGRSCLRGACWPGLP